jgi:acid stress-induced BolA-like protein IbaG/YrbA
VNLEEIKARLTTALGECEIQLHGEGNHLSITAIGDIFAGKRQVQRQQQVYALLAEDIADGSVHAVNMKLYTPEEWQAAD